MARLTIEIADEQLEWAQNLFGHLQAAVLAHRVMLKVQESMLQLNMDFAGAEVAPREDVGAETHVEEVA